MDPEKIDIISIRFEETALVIQYQSPTDVRKHSLVSTQIMLDRGHPDYGDDYEALLHKARRVLVNALDDFNTSDPYEPEDPDDDDEELGMGER